MQYADANQWFPKAELLLAEAERQYLNRDMNYQFLGVCLNENGPHLRFTPDYSGISIELSPSTMQHPNQALHQIAHEVIHLLAPVRHPPAIMLEEGLAVHFSIYAPEFFGQRYRDGALQHVKTDANSKNYWDALCSFEELVAVEPNAIRILRAREKNFYSMTSDFITEIIPNISKDLADRLCERKQMR